MTTWTKIADDLRAFMKGRVSTTVPLSALTSFKIGGPADVVAEPIGSEEMASLRVFLLRRGIPSAVLGAGTNVLCSDRGYRGVIVRTCGLKGIQGLESGICGPRFRAGAGTLLAGAAMFACRAGGKGMEPLWGIPGSVGGAVALNAGTGDACAGDFVEELRLICADGTRKVIGRQELDYGYRRMGLPAGSVVTEAIFEVPAGDPLEVKDRLRNWVRMRRERQPWRVASAGCVFKNPTVGEPAGSLIDSLAMKGSSQGAAMVSEVHANFIVNTGGATAADVLTLIERICAKVAGEYGISLELEINLLGEGLEHA